MEQVRITEPTLLLGEDGNVLKPGYCTTNLYVYNRENIKAHPSRIKEWDFYQISNDRYTVQIVFGDISFAGFGSFAFFDRETGEREDALSVIPLTFGKMNMPRTTETPHKISVGYAGTKLRVVAAKNKRYLTADIRARRNRIKADLELEVMDGLESLVMAVPFEDLPGYFYLNQKMNSMPVKGYVEIGSRIFGFSPQNSFAVLDWGRGVWPYKCHWYWGNGTTRLEDGSLFGFEIGWGFGDMSAATENMLFYNGKGHKIGEVHLENNIHKDYMQPWVFSSSDGRFEMTMTPEYDNYTSSRIGPIGNRCHQVYGKWNGTVVLDDGKELHIKDMTAFCEYSDNRW